MKKYSLLLSSIRPNTWLRIWGEMIVAAALASYPAFDLISFIKAFVATSPLLWSAAYILNDLTDKELDSQHSLRKSRLETFKQLGKTKILIIIFLLIFSSLVLGLSINTFIPFLLLLLLISELFYTVKPVRLKERYGFDIAVNIVNSAVRFLIGWFSQKITHPFPIYPLILFMSVKAIFFIGHRLQNRNLEIENKIKSTISVLSKKSIYLLLLILSLISVISFIYSLYLRILPASSIGGIIIGVGILLSYYLFMNRKKALFDMEQDLKFRNLLYLDYFIVTNLIALSIFFR